MACEIKSYCKVLMVFLVLIFALPIARADLRLAPRAVNLTMQSGQTEDPLLIRNSSDVLFIVYKNGSVQTIGDINAGKIYSNGLPVLTTYTANTTAEMRNAINHSGTYDISVSLGWGNLTSYVLNSVWTGLLGWGNLTGFTLNVPWLGKLGWANLTNYPTGCPAGQAV